MDRRSPQSREYTINGKIRLASVCLVLLNAGAAGAAAYLFSNGMPLFGWLAAFASAAATLGFVWVVTNIVLQPLYKLNLLAKSIERTPGMEVPDSTGAVETDDLLHTVSRASRQMANFIELMDEVSSGNTDAAMGDLEHADRLSESFRRLVSRVTSSIDARSDLEKLRGDIERVLSGLSRLDSEPINPDDVCTELKPLSAALEALVDRQSCVSSALPPAVADLKTLTAEHRSRVAAALELNNRSAQGLKRGVTEAAEADIATIDALRAALEPVKDIKAVLSELASSGSPENDKAHKAIRRQFDAAIHKLREAAERSLSITHAAKLVEDLASRSNLIALNASIHANGDAAEGLSTVSKEITALSQRAEKASNAIAGISDSVVRDVNEAHASIQWITSEVGKLADRIVDRELVISVAHERLRPVAEFPARAEELLSEREKGRSELYRTIEGIITCNAEISAELRTAEAAFPLFQEVINELDRLETSHMETLRSADHRSAALSSGGGGKGELITLTESM